MICLMEFVIIGKKKKRYHTLDIQNLASLYWSSQNTFGFDL